MNETFTKNRGKKMRKIFLIFIAVFVTLAVGYTFKFELFTI